MHNKPIEWPTLLLFITVYSLWALATYAAATGFTSAFLTLGLLITLQSSLQHEVIHGHPTRWQRFNTLLALPSLNLFVPFERFQELHLLHHRNWLLTDPYDDTESNFLTEAQWQALSPIQQTLMTANNTLAGRLILGPWIMHYRFVKSELALIKQGRSDVVFTWFKHLLAITPVLLWLLWLNLSPLLYLLLGVWPATSLLLLRAFTEHLPEPDHHERSAIVPSNRFWGLLFLNNNYHAIHHDQAELAWYKIPSVYQQHYAREHDRRRIAGYWQIAVDYTFKPKFPVAHPFLRTLKQKRP